MNWKSELQVLDLAPNQRLEMTCKSCGHVHYLTRATIIAQPERQYLYLDELERETVCKARKCYGQVRMALVRDGDASAFVGGMA
jgi:hypothetical protein